MQKLSSTWRQQKQIGSRQPGGQNLVKSSMTAASNRSAATKVCQPNTKSIKRLGQHVIPVGTGLRSAGQPYQKSDKQETDLSKQKGQTTGQSNDGTLRRSPRLKNGKEKENIVVSTAFVNKKSAVQAPAQVRDADPSVTTPQHSCKDTEHLGFSFSSTGDLDEDILKAMEEAEANYCHESNKATGTLLQATEGIDASKSKGRKLVIGRNTDDILLPNEDHLDENSEDLFTEIKPNRSKDALPDRKPASTTSFVKTTRLQSNYLSMNSSEINSSRFDSQPTDTEKSNELKMSLNRIEPPTRNNRATQSAILRECTNISNTKNVTNFAENDILQRSLAQKFKGLLDSNNEKETSPAGQVYCVDSQSQSPPSEGPKAQTVVSCNQITDQKRGNEGRKTETAVSNVRASTSERIANDAVRAPLSKSSSSLDPTWDMSMTSQATRETTLTQPTVDPLLLSSWGLPDPVLAQYHRCNITHMFPWQAECLALGKVLDGGNLVYSAPTSAGKTLVAELLILKRVMETKKKALFILPFVSVTREKMFYLQSMFQDAGVRVGGYMGSEAPTGGFKNVDIAVCTIEKANSLVNRLMEENILDQLGIIVVDELHMVGDAHRGYLLELLLTKVRFMTRKSLGKTTQMEDSESPSSQVSHNPTQLIGMSATLPNLDHLARWMDADLYRTDFRPVPLTQTLKVGKTLYDASLSKLRDVDPTHSIPGDEDQILLLCLETLAIGCSVLIFCPTKNWCEKLCENMAREIARLTGRLPNSNKEDSVSIKLNVQSLQDVTEQLKRTPVGLDPVLGRTVPCGVAYHHAGLSFDERDILEGAFRQGAVKILVATSTLSSGVNLPARRVIIRSVMFNRRVLDPLVYRQMAGRAGRKGVDTEGESILICKPNERDKAAKLMQAALPPVQSCLKKPGQDLSNSMKRAILEVIASGAACTPEEVSTYAGCTLLAAGLTSDPSVNVNQDDKSSTATAIQKCTKFLQEQELIILQKVQAGGESQEVFCPTQLGSATLASALSPDEALVVFSELQRARKNFVLENDLHLLYQVTPIYDQGFQPDWYEFMCTWENLSSDKRRVAELVGVEERFLIRAAQGTVSTHSAKQQHAMAIHKRFYTTLILNDLVREMPVVAAARKYGCARGQLQSLQQSAATFAGMVTVFCSKLGWTNLELLLAQFQSRLTFGVQRELCDLVRLSLLNAFRARLLYGSGFASVAAVAAAKPSDIESVLRKAVPFRSSRRAIDEKQFEVDERKKSRCIWATGRKGLTEHQAAVMIVQEAKGLLKADLGALGVEWKPKESQDGEGDAPQGSVDDGDQALRGSKTSASKPVSLDPGKSIHHQNLTDLTDPSGSVADQTLRDSRPSTSKAPHPSNNCSFQHQVSAEGDQVTSGTGKSISSGPQNFVTRPGCGSLQHHDSSKNPSGIQEQNHRHEYGAKSKAPSNTSLAAIGKLAEATSSASGSAERIQDHSKGPSAETVSLKIQSHASHTNITDATSETTTKSCGVRTRKDIMPTPTCTLHPTKRQSSSFSSLQNVGPAECNLQSGRKTSKTTRLSSEQKNESRLRMMESTVVSGENGAVGTPSGVLTRAKGKAKSVTIKAVIHVDASGTSASPNFETDEKAGPDGRKNLQQPPLKKAISNSNHRDCHSVVSFGSQSPNSMLKTASTAVQQPPRKKSISNSNHLDCHSIVSIGSQSPNPMLKTASTVRRNPNPVIDGFKPEKEIDFPPTPAAAKQNKNIIAVQETSPELFSLPNSPSQDSKEAAKDDNSSPKESQPVSPVFSPLDTQMLLFLEQQELANCKKKSPTSPRCLAILEKQETIASNEALNKSHADSLSDKSFTGGSEASVAFSPLDPEVLKLMDKYQEDETKNGPVPKVEVFTNTSPPQSSPSYSLLSSQALLFDDSTTSELDPSQATGKELFPASFTSTFPTLDSQSLKLVDGHFTARNDLAAKSASPALKTPEEGTKRVSIKGSHRRSSSTGRSTSNKKQKLVVTFCQSESPYSEFFQDEDMVLDLAETLECSFVIDLTEPFTDRVTQNLAAHNMYSVNEQTLHQLTCNSKINQLYKRKSIQRGSSVERLSVSRSAGNSLAVNQDKVEPSYSHLEEDLALAAEWSDFFSPDKSQQVQSSPTESKLNDDDQGAISNIVKKLNVNQRDEKEKVTSTKFQTEPEIGLHGSEIQSNGVPGNSSLSSTKMRKSERTERKPQDIETESMKKISAKSVGDKTLSDQLSPGTVAMLDLFAGDSFSQTYSPFAKTVSNPTSAPKNKNQNSFRGLTSVDNHKMDETTREHRKRRSGDGITEVIQDEVPAKKPCQKRCPPTDSETDNETQDARRKSEGDLIPPTPPKDKANTPKLLKGTPKQNHLKDVLEMDTPRSIRLKQRSTTKQTTKKMQGNTARNPNTPLQRTRKSPRSKKNILKSDVRRVVPLKHLSSPATTPQIFSPMRSDVDLNAAQCASQLYLHLDSESSFEIEPPTPQAKKPGRTKRLQPPSSPSSSRSKRPPTPLQASSSQLQCTQGTFTIIDVCSSKELFETFLKEWSNKPRYSLSVACEKYLPPVEGGGIGGNIRKAVSKPKKSGVDGFQVGDERLIVTGLSICWEDKDAYFVSLQQDVKDVDPDDSLAQPPLDPALTIQDRLRAVKTRLEQEFVEGRGGETEVYKLAFDCKEHYKVLSRGCGVTLQGHLADPKVAHWLIDPGSKERNLHGMVTHYIPHEAPLLEGISGGVGVSSLGLLGQEWGTGRLRAATESVLVLSLMDNLESTLREDGLYRAFSEVEMPCMGVLARMELTGFGFSPEECETQKAIMQAKLAALEEQAYQMAGHGFSLTSPEDIAQVLYVELQLPPNGDPTLTSTTTAVRKTLGTRGGRARLPKHFSTAKDSLEKLRPFHSLPGVILEWRRISAAVTKVVFPLLKEKKADERLGQERIYATCQTHTATGRVSLSDPNIQAIPRDFEMEMPSAIGESPPLGAGPSTVTSYHTRTGTRHRQGPDRQGRGTARMAKEGVEPGPSCAVSVRHAFCPFQGGVLLAADYSQLELRILAHLSRDTKLVGILNGGGDVFKCIAAQWRRITEGDVTPKQRQQAKQICYGMVYGIGAKALGQQLGVSEEDAAAFMDSFKMQYKGMKTYIKDTVAKCRTNGYVETILHRKRFLPAINHTNPAARNQAERQAVNTTIQGSAADLVKAAMVRIDRRLVEEFPNTALTHRHRRDLELGSTQRRKSRRFTPATPSGAFLVLQLHDELIYEVHREDVIQVAQLVKTEMESALKLSVRVPVKVKVGPTWGRLEELDI